MPAATKHDAVLTKMPKARKALAALRSAGHSDLADLAEYVFDYAKEQAERGVAKNTRDKGLGGHSIRVTREFRAHVHAALTEDSATVAEVVTHNFRDFLSGSWTPPAPARARRGTSVGKVGLNMRLKEEDADLWDQVDALGKDPEAVATRGYKLTAEYVARAALEATFGEPEGSTTA